MRGRVTEQRSLLMVGSVEDRIPAKHPIRRIKALADRALSSMSDVFSEMYSEVGRPSVPPERLLKAQLLIALFSVRSDRQFCEQLDYNLMFRWFLDLELDEDSFDASTFSHNRERLIRHDVGKRFLSEIVELAKAKRLLSDEHFSVDGTLIEAWASIKSFRPKDEPPQGGSNSWKDFRGEKLKNETHSSRTDPDAKLYRKSPGVAAKLSYCGSVLMENRTGLIVDADIAPATGTAERDGALEMLGRRGGKSRLTLGADKGYDTSDFVAGCRELEVTPHVTQNVYPGRSSSIDARTTRHRGYSASQAIRRTVEKTFGWLKTCGGWKRTRFRGIDRVTLDAYISVAAYDILRLSKVLEPKWEPG